MSQDALPAVRRRDALAPGSLRVIRQSAPRLARDQELFIRQLRHDVAGLIPASAVPRGFDGPGFCGRMIQTLLWTALTEQPQHVVVGTLRELGAQNWAQGFPDGEYASFAHALIQTLRYLMANDWSTSTGSAWISLFMWVKPHLLVGAQQAAAQRAAAAEAAARETAARRAAAEEEAARVEALFRESQDEASQAAADASIDGPATLADDHDDEGILRLGQIAFRVPMPRMAMPRMAMPRVPMPRNPLGQHSSRIRYGWSAPRFSHHDLLSKVRRVPPINRYLPM